MSNPKFTIITITFDSEKTVERTLKSVLNQTFKDFEYIIVDGASKDGTLDIVRKYEPLFEGRMKWESEPDKGIYDAMNKGILRSSGQLIGIVNSDDWLESDALANVYSSFLKKHESEDIVYCGGIKYHYDDHVDTLKVDIEKFRKNAWKHMMFGVRHPGTFVPKNIYTNIGIFDSELKLSADRDFILRCYFRGYEFYDINSIVSNMSAGGFSTGGGKKAAMASRADRKKSLHNFGITGPYFYFLYYYWRIRGAIRKLVIRTGIKHGH